MANRTPQAPTTPQAGAAAQRPVYAEQGAQPVLDGADHRKAIADEFGEWVAVQPIYFGSVRAYNAGDPVPRACVAEYRYAEQGLVKRATTQAAGEAVSTAAGDGDAADTSTN